ncbi:hypothetical protein [uncultured Jannaschia sp.]|uniref:hypothetical protein n=1 Tax=uncultured Jannaschia sp. TaxID=293347 RepID=UPI0026175F7E|nr:hypothetical protein [uncultured Jannaschia sp.]
MIRILTAAILSAAIALPATTAPARADAEDVAKVLGGLAALYILKEAVERNRERRAAPVARAPVHQPEYYSHRHSGLGAHSHRTGTDHTRAHPHRDRPRQDRRNVRVLPEQCYVTLRTDRGLVSGYGARCMQNAVARPGALPPQCIRQLRTDRGPRNIYGPRCLARDGWSPRTARR